MRTVLAALTDAVIAGLLGFLGFVFALWATPCHGNEGNCFPLTPIVVACVLAAQLLYFGLGFFAWRDSPGRHLWRAQAVSPPEDPRWWRK